jgi:hypothetical protein
MRTLLTLCLVLSLVAASAPMQAATVVSFAGAPVTLQTTKSRDFSMRAGVYNGQIIWFVPFAASNLNVATQLNVYSKYKEGQKVDWAPAMSCALTKDVLGDVYLINCAQQILFSSEPGLPDYTPLWRVHYLEWVASATRTPLNSAADVQAALAAGKLLAVIPDSVLDATIVIGTSGQVIKQTTEFDFRTSRIELPMFKVFYSAASTNWKTKTRWVLLVDTNCPSVADVLGANLAPRLGNIGDCCNNIYAFENPVPPSQLPIADQIKSYRLPDKLQTNTNYNPIRCWTVFDRGSLSLTTTITSAWNILDLFNHGFISKVDLQCGVVSNSPQFKQEIED